MSASDILDKMLSAMPESYQKTIGFPTYDLLAAVSLRMEGTDTTIDEARQQLDPENLHDSALDRYIYPRSGLERKAATFAHGSLTVTGTGTVEQGTLFESGGGVQYYATETVAIEGEGTVPVTCTVDGFFAFAAVLAAVRCTGRGEVSGSLRPIIFLNISSALSLAITVPSPSPQTP